MDYTWAITNIRKGPSGDLSDVVLHVRWTLTGTDADGDTGAFQGATPLSPPTGDFTPFEELTEAQVLGWVQAVVVGDYRDHVYGQIAKQIAAKKSAVVDMGAEELPWATPVVTPAAPE